LLPPVLSAANTGDANARAVLSRAGAELATLAAIVITRLFVNAEIVPVAVSGGVFCHSALTRQVFEEGVRDAHPQASVNTAVIDPVNGALALARKNG
jgi:N-acetylglucosamine kinase-like BadF-type ATPase